MPLLKDQNARMEVLHVIDEYIMKNDGLRPSVRTVTKLRGKVNPHSTFDMMKELEASGFLSRPSGNPQASDWTVTTTGRTELEKWRKQQRNGNK